MSGGCKKFYKSKLLWSASEFKPPIVHLVASSAARGRWLSNLCLMVGSSVLRWMATRIVLSCALATDDNNDTNVNANNSRYLFQWSNWPCSDVEQLCRVMMCQGMIKCRVHQQNADKYTRFFIMKWPSRTRTKLAPSSLKKPTMIWSVPSFILHFWSRPFTCIRPRKVPFLLKTIMFWPVKSNCNPRRRVIIIINNAMDINVPQ